MTPHWHWIRNYTPYRVPIHFADNRVIYSEGVGTIVFRPLVNKKDSRDVELTQILHVPALQNNLLPVLYLMRQKQFDIHISFNTISFSCSGSVLFTATMDDNNIGYLNGTVTTFLIPNYYYFILTHHSDPIAFDSSHMTYLFQAQSALLRFTAELSQLVLLLDYSSHDYSALLIMTHYA